MSLDPFAGGARRLSGTELKNELKKAVNDAKSVRNPERPLTADAKRPAINRYRNRLCTFRRRRRIE
ncbi:MAG TPA: hypothetical protein VGL08_17815 [Paraburkholderia sp.]|jgi:hypothetical protein